MPQQLSDKEVRQGQNVRGMIWVLLIGIAAVVVAYTIMLALTAEPVREDGSVAGSVPAAEDAAAPTTSAAETQ